MLGGDTQSLIIAVINWLTSNTCSQNLRKRSLYLSLSHSESNTLIEDGIKFIHGGLLSLLLMSHYHEPCRWVQVLLVMIVPADHDRLWPSAYGGICSARSFMHLNFFMSLSTCSAGGSSNHHARRQSYSSI